MHKIVFALLCTLVATSTTAQTSTLLIGTYDKDSSSGIYVYEFNTKTGGAELKSNVALPNASFLTVAPNKKNVYAVSEKRTVQIKEGK